MAVISIDLGGTKIAGAVMDSEGRIHFTHRNLLNGREGGAVGHLVAENVSRLFEKARYHRLDIEAVGVCVPGLADAATGTVWCPNIGGWDNFPLRHVIQNVTGADVPIVIDNDRACYVSGERWQGVAQNCRNVIFLAVGTGIGAGIIVDGRPLNGAGGIIGATGWMALDAPYKEEYRQVGCFEYYASGRGICERAREAVRADKSYRGYLRQRPVSRLTTNHVFEAYSLGDAIAESVLGRAREMWGMGAANLVSLLNPEMIVWGGGVFGPARAFLPEIYGLASQWAQPLAIKHVRFEATALGAHAGLYGAAWLALQSFKGDGNG